ncbi:MAG: hypothetical protein WBD24_01965 [Candidatus Omnitrophota bacterium]
MKKLFILIVLTGFILSGCGTTKFGIDTVKVYKTKMDRVDQAVVGNRGYIVGESPEGPVPERKRQRTMIVVDWDVPDDFIIGEIGRDLPGEEETTSPEKTSGCVTREEVTKSEEWIK